MPNPQTFLSLRWESLKKEKEAYIMALQSHVTQLKRMLENYFGPTKGEGRAGKDNVKNTRMYPFLKEMAETRSVNRALRLYTGYGGTSYEEMPQAQIAAD